MALSGLVEDLRVHPRWVGAVDDSVHLAAVAAIFAPMDGALHLLFIRRAECEGDPWSGHMAFPGGRVDATDATVEAAVFREVNEEVGLDLPALGQSRGVLSDVVTPPLAKRLVVTPFVYELAEVPRLSLDAQEVADVHWFALDRFLSREGRGTFPYRYRGQQMELGCIDIDGVRIWGMTLRILDELCERIRRLQ